MGRATAAGPVPKALRPIFRDREDFSAGHSLAEQTLAALEASQFLVVICSPNSAKSPYVNEEIRRFKALGRADRVIPVIVDGEPGDAERDCFPAALRFKVGADGAITDAREEPIAADARPQGDGKDIAALKVVAGLVGVGLDEIVRRAERVRRQRLRKWVGALAVLVLVLASLAGWAEINRREAEQQRTLAEEQRQLAEEQRQVADQQRQVAVDERQRADEQRAEAERNFEVARRAADALVTDIAQGLRDVEGMRVETVRRNLDRPRTCPAGLVERAGNDKVLMFNQAKMLLEFATTYARLGDTAKEFKATMSANRIIFRLAADNPNDRQLKRDLAITYSRLGDVGRNRAACWRLRCAINRALACSRAWPPTAPSACPWSGRASLAVAYDDAADVLRAQGKLGEAVTAHRRACRSRSGWCRPSTTTPAGRPASRTPPMKRSATFSGSKASLATPRPPIEEAWPSWTI